MAAVAAVTVNISALKSASLGSSESRRVMSVCGSGVPVSDDASSLWDTNAAPGVSR